MKPKKPNVRNVNKWTGYYLEDTACQLCLYFKGTPRVCTLKKCCCEEEKADAVANRRIKRKRGFDRWDG